MKLFVPILLISIYILPFVVLADFNTHDDNIDPKKTLIFGDQLNPSYSDFSYGSRRISSKKVRTGTHSISIGIERSTSLWFGPTEITQGFDRYSNISFYINVGKNIDIPMEVILRESDNKPSRSILLTNPLNPQQSITGKSSFRKDIWEYVNIPIYKFYVEGDTVHHFYRSIMIRNLKQKANETIYIDDIEESTPVAKTLPSEPLIDPFTLPTQAKEENTEEMVLSPNKQNLINNCLSRGAYPQIYKVLEPAQPYFTRDPIAHSFYSTDFKELGNDMEVPQWLFMPQMGRIYFINDTFIRVAGPILPKHVENKWVSNSGWWVDLLFEKSVTNNNFKTELPDDFYVGRSSSGKINTDTWKLYLPVRDQANMIGFGGNQKRILKITDVAMNVPLMVGEGANGKNTDLGMSVWLEIDRPETPQQDKIIMDMNVNIVDPPPIQRNTMPHALCRNDSMALVIEAFLDLDHDYLRDNEEMGVPGVIVHLTDKFGNPIYDVNGKEVRPVKTDIDGRYYFDKLEIGDYKVNYHFQAPLHAQTPNSFYTTTPVPGSNTFSRRIYVDHHSEKTVQSNEFQHPVRSCNILIETPLALAIE